MSIIGTVISIVGIVIALVIFGVQTAQMNVSESRMINQSKLTQSTCQKIAENGTFSNFCGPTNLTIDTGITNASVENGAVLIDGHDIVYQIMPLPDSSANIAIDFKPIWKLKEGVENFLFDIIGDRNNLLIDRISVYIMNGYLRFKIQNVAGTEEHEIKIKLNESNWNEQNFNRIQIGWVKEQGRMLMELNGGSRIDKRVGNIDLNVSDTIFFLGSDIFGNLQANGYFDKLLIWQQNPDINITIGPAEFINN